jgi:hypothetical protein
MAIISECYFDSCDTKWDYRGQLGELRLAQSYVLDHRSCASRVDKF